MTLPPMLEPKFITRPIKRALKTKGIDLLKQGKDDASGFDETMNATLDMLYPNHTVELDSMPYGDLQKLFMECMTKTFPSAQVVEK